MPRNVWLLAWGGLMVAALGATAGPGLFKKRPDATRVPTLMETLSADPDEKKRLAAAEELGRADSRLYPEVAAALVLALQKDSSPAVRAEAAYALGQLGQVFALAGQALEEAADRDTSFSVRLAARRTLWEYHLMGYRGAKTPDHGLTPTDEPPLASPPGPRNAAAIVRTAPPTPPTAQPRLPAGPERSVAIPPVPVVSPPLGPRLFRSMGNELLAGSRRTATPPPPPAASLSSPPPVLNLTHEPPLAPQPIALRPPVSQPVLFVPPPTLPVRPELPELPQRDYIPRLPPLPWEPTDLPPIVPDPEASPLPVVKPAPAASFPPAIPATLPPRPAK
ncbi:MAG: HEAT repeat domain-containing protein [Gemmataceae bacterium]|nr:HEAT repeat domain-containing protein [Gemmata sp.]MDW8198708.1 HEAT repeat domain-containing protein [Gemmataceae bacterium]